MMDHRPRPAPSPPPWRADRPPARPTRSPRAPAPATRRGATAPRHPRVRGPRFAPAVPGPLALPPCPELRPQPVTCLCRLAGALLETCRPAADAEQGLVEVAHQRIPVAVEKDGDQEAPQQLAARLAQLPGEVGALGRGRAEQRRTAHRSGPGAVAFPEGGLERMPELLAAERVGLEERQLPPVERLAEVRVSVGRAEAHTHVAGDRGSE